MQEISTSPVDVTLNGAIVTFDVTGTNLAPNLALKDFVVQNVNTGELLNNANFTKLSPTSLRYNGLALDNVLCRVFRVTPVERYEYIEYASRFDSSTYNEEIFRILLMIAERISGYASFVDTELFITNADYSSDWALDTYRGRSARALYDKFEEVQGDIDFLTQQLAAISTGVIIAEPFGVSWSTDTVRGRAASSIYNQFFSLDSKLDGTVLGLQQQIDALNASAASTLIFASYEGITQAALSLPATLRAVRSWLNPTQGAGLELEDSGVLIPNTYDGKTLEISGHLVLSGAHNESDVYVLCGSTLSPKLSTFKITGMDAVTHFYKYYWTAVGSTYVNTQYITDTGNVACGGSLLIRTL